jgi:hypothetical protein
MTSGNDIESVAHRFILRAVQDWGQPEAQRIAAVQSVLTAAGFAATATCSPVFGAIWPKPCDGPDSQAASAWLKNLCETMPRGKFEREVEHVAAAIGERVALRGAA